jgi:hypothetical protein
MTSQNRGRDIKKQLKYDSTFNSPLMTYKNLNPYGTQVQTKVEYLNENVKFNEK